MVQLLEARFIMPI